GGGPPHGQPMKRRLRASSADLISVTGHSRGLHQTLIEAQYDPLSQREILIAAAPEVPRPRNSSVPSSRPKQSGGSGQRPVQLVRGSVEGQQPAHLMTDHQEG